MKAHFVLSLLAVAAAGVAAGYLLRNDHAPAQPVATSSTPVKAEISRNVLYWYDPMVPGQRFDKPGKSPFMDMELVPRYADEVEQDGGVTISARQQQNLGVRTEKVAMRTLNYQLNAFGTVTTDERGVQIISARANGIIEKLYVRASQQQVKKNQPLAVLWIPDWAAAQQEYLAVRQLGDTALTAAARQRLQLQFMPEEIIRQVEKTAKPQTRVTISAPIAGFVNKLEVREGAQITTSQTLFELASLDPVWVIVDYPASQAALLSVGSSVTATSGSWPGQSFGGQISELLPNIDSATRTFKARIVLHNPQQQLKPGMYLQVQLAQNNGQQQVLAIPQEALLLTGSRSTVLVTEGNGHFKPVNVVAGQAQDGWIEIKQGLSAGQQVVTSGQFLIDSEASLRSALPQLAAQQGTATPTEAQYSGRGVIESINDDGITLTHEPIPELKWPAMTMDFALPAAGLPSSVKVGSNVIFHFTLDDNGAKIIQFTPATPDKAASAHGGH